MNEAGRQAYQQVVRTAAKRLGVGLHGNVEQSLIRHALKLIGDWIAAHGQPKNLSELLRGIATSYRVDIVEVASDDDLEVLLHRIPPTTEPALARVADELDDDTDAVILQRQGQQPWEMPYLAVINCRDGHYHRRYFSKWHEVVHLLLDGKQLRFAFRKTNSIKKHPEEVLVDKIAGAIAFYPAIFDPVLKRELAGQGLTFDLIDRVRQEIAPDASREATINACLRGCSDPVCYVRARIKHKRAEEKQLNDLLSTVAQEEAVPQAKLRVESASASRAVQNLGIRLHKNVEVPETSIVATAFNEPGKTHHGRESFESWRTSDGPLGKGMVQIEAVRRWNEVHCIMTFLPGAVAADKVASKTRKTSAQIERLEF